MDNITINNEKKILRTIASLKKNNMHAYLAANTSEVLALIKEIVPEGSTVSCGGSETLKQTGISDFLASGYYKFLDRTKENITPEEIRQIYAETHNCDAFFTSANAICESGELYNVDGNGNRVSAIANGPKKVIVIAGENKIVRDLPAALYRVKTVAAPLNALRLGLNTPCALTGKCAVTEGVMTTGCSNPKRMCVQYLVSGFQRDPDRFHIIFLNTSLGY
jgi:L-lactate utilization protein LutB